MREPQSLGMMLYPAGCRDSIEELAGSLRFPLKKLFVVDGSKRSAHSNAYMCARSPAACRPPLRYGHLQKHMQQELAWRHKSTLSPFQHVCAQMLM